MILLILGMEFKRTKIELQITKIQLAFDHLVQNAKIKENSQNKE